VLAELDEQELDPLLDELDELRDDEQDELDELKLLLLDENEDEHEE